MGSELLYSIEEIPFSELLCEMPRPGLEPFLIEVRIVNHFIKQVARYEIKMLIIIA